MKAATVVLLGLAALAPAWQGGSEVSPRARHAQERKAQDLNTQDQDGQEQDAQDVDYAKALAPIAAFAGAHRGRGQLGGGGGYEERWDAEWINDKSALALRTVSQIQGATVFEDLRVFSYDKSTKRIRVRQFARGMVAVFDVEVGDGGKELTLKQTALEGGTRPEWRYRYKLGQGENGNQIHYRLEQKAGDEFRLYVMGRLVPKSE